MSAGYATTACHLDTVQVPWALYERQADMTVKPVILWPVSLPPDN